MYLGKASLSYEEPVYIQGYASVVGKKEGEGPLACLLYTSPSPRDRG